MSYADYDRRILQKLADSLYRRADSIAYTYTIVFAALGGLLGFGATRVVAPTGAGSIWLVAGAGVLCGLIGAAVGSAEAFKLRVQAQQTLWMIQIEKILTEGKQVR